MSMRFAILATNSGKASWYLRKERFGGKKLILGDISEVLKWVVL